MDRLTYINVAGKNYPMSFSLQAMKILAKKSGSVGNAISKITDKELDADTIDMITEVLEMLITQGCAYKNYFEKDLPTKEDDPVIDGKWTPLPKEVLEIGLQLRDMDAVAKAIEECVDIGQEKEVTAIEDDSKNMEAGQVLIHLPGLTYMQEKLEYRCANTDVCQLVNWKI